MFSTRNKFVVKLLRANGGCLGAGKRRRTWQAAISLGEPQAGIDPGMSERGNLGGLIPTGPWQNSWATTREPRELKHLSTSREKKATAIALVAASERAPASTRFEQTSLGLGGAHKGTPAQ